MQIPLNGKKGKGKFAIIDDEDLYKISDRRWYLDCNGYAIDNKKRVRMHRIIMNPPKGMVIDHINHNTLDNRKENLRVCSLADNNANRLSPECYFDASCNSLVARTKIDGKWVRRFYDNEHKARKIAAKMKSGDIPLFNLRANRKVRLPSGEYVTLPMNVYLYYNRGKFMGYMFSVNRYGVHHQKRGFSTISEAEEYKKTFYDNIDIIKKGEN